MKLKKWQLWTIVGLSLGIAALLIWWNLNTDNIAPTVLLIIDFIIMTFSLQIALAKTFRFKPKKPNYVTKEFELDLDTMLNNLKACGYKERKNRYGFSYLKINNGVAYKVTFINNPDEYLEPVEGKAEEDYPGINKCKKFIGFEIFIDYNDKILDRLADFSFQGKNIYYEGYYIAKEDNKLIEANVITPDPEFKDLALALKQDLGAVDNNVGEK